GWCVAGALAFETARQLSEDRHEIAHLFLIDSWLPNYFDRLPAPRRFVGAVSLRLQLIWADWRRVMSRKKPIRAFITQRMLYKRLHRWATGAPADGAAALDKETAATPETYDQWLLAYLQRVTKRYTPKPYRGAVTVLRSRLEPTGLFFQPDAGWGAVATGGVDVRFVDGDHFTMFQEPGSAQLSAHVAAVLAQEAPSGRREPANPPG
ncbi:MAG: thioesterase domain-containing protein, partial [Pseudomonadota bacterium]|nr:thioesterase domain-containing protein [Pseudomonadota bacterium]